jgi:hypothetical protein
LAEVDAHHVAGFQGIPCTSISPVRPTPAASTMTASPRAAWIDPDPVALGKDCTAAVLSEELPLIWLAVVKALARSSVPAPVQSLLPLVTGRADEVSAYFTWSGVRLG